MSPRSGRAMSIDVIAWSCTRESWAVATRRLAYSLCGDWHDAEDTSHHDHSATDCENMKQNLWQDPQELLPAP
jgi:hypothetical protein